jgi:hypothetical protein
MATTGATGGDLATSRAGVGRAVRRLATETKQAFKTTEFWAMVGLIVAILISAAVINGGDNGTDELSLARPGSTSRFSARATSSRAGLPSPEGHEPYSDDPGERDSRGSGGDRNGVR